MSRPQTEQVGAFHAAVRAAKTWQEGLLWPASSPDRDGRDQLT